MKSLDLNKLVRIKNPQKGEENLIFRVVNFNEVTGRCYIELITPLPGLNMRIPPQELVSITDIVNVEYEA
jgi:hypothetical protein